MDKPGAAPLDRERVGEALRACSAHAAQGEEARAWMALQPLMAAASSNEVAARGLATAMGLPELDRDGRLAVARDLLADWPDHGPVLSLLGEATESLVDLRYLNAAAPDEPFFADLVAALQRLVDGASDEGTRIRAARALTTASRIAGRRFDTVCEQAHQLLVAAEPDNAVFHYNWGLFCKNRGRFEDGYQANLRAEALFGEPNEAVLWNLSICATACGHGEAALERWRSIGCTLDLGEDGLPQGSWPTMQVRLAERPVAERRADTDDPGDEETVWVERLSPCHGRIRSALVHDLGVDYGDIVLFDGAPIVHRTFGERHVPVHPHLATLRREGWRTLPFAGTQSERGQIAEAGLSLPGQADLYVHTEQFRTLCRTCWERPEQHEHEPVDRRVVTGKLVLPPDLDLAVAGAALDAAASGSMRVFVPELWAELGEVDRAEVERRRMGMLNE